VQPVPDVDSHFDQVQALQLISAGNIINLGIFAFILTLQVRRGSSQPLICALTSYRRARSTRTA
jgi:hypothetical protein